MGERIFDPLALACLALPAGFALLAGVGVGRSRHEGTASILRRAVEAAALAPLGGFLSRSFIGLLLSAGGDSSAATFAVGWGFFLWPGAVDTLLVALHGKPIFTPTVLLGLAAGVGSFVGLMDGVWRVHRFRGAGALTFLLDVTWGLAGSTNGCLVHLANVLLRARHDGERRGGAHRYFDGFRLKAGFAVTLGSVMTNVPAHAVELLRHERQHVLQNRLFGPLYTLTYLGWMALMLSPALAVGAVKGAPWRTIEGWCYLNNPWETWAYARGGWRDPGRVWNGAARASSTALFFLGVLGAVLWVVHQVWLH